MMKQLVILGLFVLLLAAVQYAKAQSVDDVIEQHLKARGGREKLAALQTVYMEGSRDMMGNEASIKVYKQQGKLSRTEFEVGSNTGFSLITDQGGWNYFSMRGGEPNKMPDQAHAGQLTELDIQGPLMDYAAKGHKVELLGKETRDNIECVRLKLTTSAGKEITYWLNGSTFLIHQTSTKGGMMGGGGRNPDAETITTYSDYQEIEGIKFPLTVGITITGGQGRGGGNTTFDKVELNKPVDAKLFKPE